MSNNKQKLGTVLVDQGLINQDQLNEALKKQNNLALPIAETLIDCGFITQEAMLIALSKFLDVDYFDLSENNYLAIDKSLQSILPFDICQRLMVLPLFSFSTEKETHLTVAMSDPLNNDAIKELERITGNIIAPVLTTSTSITHGITKMYDIEVDIPEEEQEIAFDDTEKANLLVNNLLVQAINRRASDIHFEPHLNHVHIRFRVDGVLQLIETTAKNSYPATVSRVKIMGSEQGAPMRIDEKRTPQDGAFTRIIGKRQIDFRISTLPTIHGEKVVIRIFDTHSISILHTIESLKMTPSIEKKFKQAVKKPSGIIIVTGPTGSGKTTTLHAAIEEINTVDLNIVTVEDPVEFHARDYVNQSSLMPLAGYDYLKALRAILRQDPDIILIGEIRDKETAEIAIRAALTGHLVLTTLHTEDAASVAVRLVDLGIAPYLVATNILLSLNQRLLRIPCQKCSEKYVPHKDELLEMSITDEISDQILSNLDNYNIKRKVGCSFCNHTGYSGRHGIFELLSITPKIKTAISNRFSSDSITEKARESQTTNMLFEEGLIQVLNGVTTFDELRRVPRGNYKLKSIDNIMQAAG